MAEDFTLTPVDEEPLRLTPVEDFKLTPVEEDTRLTDFMTAPDAVATESSPISARGAALAAPATISALPSEITPLSTAEIEATLFEPAFTIPESVKEAAAASTVLGQMGKRGREAALGIQDTAAGLVEAAPSPGGLALLGAQAIPGLNVALDVTLGASMAKGGAEKLGEASVTKDLREAAQGASELLLGAAGAMGGTAKALGERRAALRERATPPVIPLQTTTALDASRTALGDAVKRVTLDPVPEEPILLGLSRPSRQDPSLRLLTEEEFDSHYKAITTQLDKVEAEYDTREFSRPEQEALGRLQDQFDAVELEKYRRDVSQLANEELFHDALNLTDTLNLDTPLSKLQGEMSFQKLSILREVLSQRTGREGEMVGEWFKRFLARNADAQEVYGGR